jgi:multidrug efflux pump subunit AcrA (membrane-fusion protein)
MLDSRWTETQRQRVAAVVRYATPAFAHAVEQDRVFLRPLWTWLGDWRTRLSASLRLKLATTAALAGVLLLVLCVVPASFNIAARGELQPSRRWDIFAPEAGTVVSIPVRHGQSVRQGELLVGLENTEIEVQLTELLGRQRVTQEQLEASQRAILDSGNSGRARLSVAEENRIGGEVLQLRQALAGIEKEIALVRQKQANLYVRAPHGGEVITWQVEQQLLRRSVQPGQALLTVVDPQGPWELELRLPERRLKHLDAALAAHAEQPLEVTFMLSTLPGTEFCGQVTEVERAAEVRGEAGNTVLVRVSFDKESLPPLRSGTTVTAKLHCGYEPLGYVWFCDLIESVQTSVLFWL